MIQDGMPIVNVQDSGTMGVNKVELLQTEKDKVLKIVTKEEIDQDQEDKFWLQNQIIDYQCYIEN